MIFKDHLNDFVTTVLSFKHYFADCYYVHIFNVSRWFVFVQITDYWGRSSDEDFLDSILFNHGFDLLPGDDDIITSEPLSAPISSSSSDSGKHY